MFYLKLFAALEKHHVRYLLVGGLAMNLHGVPRLTMDVDLIVALDDSNLQGFLAACSDLGLRPALPVALSELADKAKREEWVKRRRMIAFSLLAPEKTAPTLDILIGATIAFEPAYERRAIRDVAGIEVSLAAVEDLIALKAEAGRAQDMADVAQLRRLSDG